MIGALVAAQCDAEGGPGFSFSVRGRLRETLHLGKAVWRHDADPFKPHLARSARASRDQFGIIAAVNASWFAHPAIVVGSSARPITMMKR